MFKVKMTRSGCWLLVMTTLTRLHPFLIDRICVAKLNSSLYALHLPYHMYMRPTQVLSYVSDTQSNVPVGLVEPEVRVFVKYMVLVRYAQVEICRL